jgi:quinol monooxygenase YgiN
MSELQGIARIKVHHGKFDEFKPLVAACLESVRTKDTGTLQYDVFVSSDEAEYVVLERYRDSEALLEHTANLGETMAALLATCSIEGEILGMPSLELLQALEGSGVRVYKPYQAR